MGKILILTNNDIGLYKFRKELIKELLIDNDVYISLPKGEWIPSLVNMGCKFINTPIDRRGINPWVDFKLIRSYNNMLNKLKPDLVITYTIKPNIYGGIISRLKNIKYALNITGLGSAFQDDGYLKKIIIILYKIASKKAKVVFFENEENKRTFLNEKVILEERAYKLNGAGVNLEEYSYCEYPKNRNEIRFLFIGRVMKEKGIDELLEVAERIHHEHPNVYFDIVGPEEDSYAEKLKLLQDKGIINYHGYQKDVKPFIKQTNCLILPSYHEGMANTLLESGAMGRPLIASNIPGCREAIVEGQNGYLIEPKNSKDLYMKVSSFINLSDYSKEKMAFFSRRYIAEKFNKKIIVKKTIEEVNKAE